MGDEIEEAESRLSSVRRPRTDIPNNRNSGENEVLISNGVKRGSTSRQIFHGIVNALPCSSVCNCSMAGVAEVAGYETRD